jgi:glutamine amidotransferase
MTISVVDLGISNLGSLTEALRRIGVASMPVSTPDEILVAERLVLPGVGTFQEGMAAIRRLGVEQAIVDYAASGRQLLGICLGMQLLLDVGEEFGPTPGLGIIPGAVTRLQRWMPHARIPNIGWCDVTVRTAGGELCDPTPQSFFFVHSYFCDCSDEADVVATIDFGRRVPAVVGRGNVHGVQFHPEKSQDAGLNFLARFAALP